MEDVQLTDQHRRLLALAAEHKLVLASQAAVLLSIKEDTAARKLRALCAEGLLKQDRPFDDERPCFQVTRAGLGAVRSELGAPRRVDRTFYGHDVGVGWIFLAARRGFWGELGDVVSERRMRSLDGSAHAAAEAAGSGLVSGRRFGVRLGGTGPGGRERLHYPDVLLIDRASHRIAVELELSAKSRPRLDVILAGYAADPSIDVVLYLVDRRSVGNRVESMAARLGISDLVHVQPVSWGGAAPGDGAARAATRTGARAPRRRPPRAGAVR